MVEASVAIKFIFGFCRFPDISGRFWNTKNEQVEAENYDSTGGKEKQMNISKETDFRADQKNPYFVIYRPHAALFCENYANLF